jgi:subfamily B ATP-binding cassette protein MsbA
VAWLDGRAGHEIRTALSRNLLSFGFGFFLRNDSARLVTIVSTEAWRTSDALRTVFTIAASGASSAVFAVLLCLVNVKLSLLVGAGILVIRVVQALYAKKLEALSRRVSATNHELAESMLLIIEAMRLIRIFGQERREQRRFEAASDRVRRAIYDVEASSSRIAPMLEVLLSVLFVGVLLVASRAGMPPAELLAFLVLLYRMQPHLVAVSQARVQLAALGGSVREVEWLLDVSDKPQGPSGRTPVAAELGAIRFEDVSFAYEPAASEPGVAVLSGANMTFRPHRSTALIGRSGAGKSTIVNLLCRLLEPSAGRITIDGTDLRELDPAQWRGRIAIAGQDIEFADGTIAENIAYGVQSASHASIVRAARFADADAFIRQLPQGYDTWVGSRGLTLSGGQRQRIGLARALLRDPELLILDEATSAVDGISEAAIMQLLRNQRQRRTTIVISHRITTLACCDDGIVLENGGVRESGVLTSLAFYQQQIGTGARTAHGRGGAA